MAQCSVLACHQSIRVRRADASLPSLPQEFLQVHRRNKLVKRELWLRITQALQPPAA